MKLKSFNKVACSTKTRYTVHKENTLTSPVVDSFVVDYFENDIEHLNAMIIKKTYLERSGAEVIMVMPGINSFLNVDVVI